jgi:hypothetical protein
MSTVVYPGRNAGRDGLPAADALSQLAVDPQAGLDPEEGRAPTCRGRAEQAGGGRKGAGVARVQLVLLGAAIVSIVALQEWSTGVVNAFRMMRLPDPSTSGEAMVLG